MGTLEQSFIRTIRLIRRLRAEDGCPWDRAHHFSDYLKMLLEEGRELQSALTTNDDDEIFSELGDTIWNAIYLLVLGEDERGYKMEEVLNKVCEKIISRHPHVFGSAVARTPDEVLKIWQQLKEQERRSRQKRSDRAARRVRGDAGSLPRRRKPRNQQPPGNH